MTTPTNPVAVCDAIGPHHGDRCSAGRIQSPNAQFTQDCKVCGGTGVKPADASGEPVQPMFTGPNHHEHGTLYEDRHGRLHCPDCNQEEMIRLYVEAAVKERDAEVAALKAERDHLRNELDSIRGKSRAHCEHCGWTDRLIDRDEAAAKIREHVKACEASVENMEFMVKAFHVPLPTDPDSPYCLQKAALALLAPNPNAKETP